MQRRSFLTTAAAGALGATAVAANEGEAIAPTAQEDQPDVRVVGEHDTADFRTIQAAHDDLPEGGPNRRDGSGLIVVDGSYDSANEEFPIHVDKYVDIHGRSLTRCQVHSDDPDEDVFYIENPNDVSFFQRTNMSNLYIRGGRNGIVLDGMTHFSGDHLIVRDCAQDGITAVRNRSNSFVGGLIFRKVMAWSCGGNGFSLPPAAGPHGSTLWRCNATYCDGDGLHLGGFGTNVLGGAYQSSGGTGIRLEAFGGAQGLYNVYFEYNGGDATDARDVVVENFVLGANIENCYFNGNRSRDHADTHAAVGIHGEGFKINVNNCTFGGYDWDDVDSGLFHVSDEAVDPELNLGSHMTFWGDADTFQRRPETFYSNGVRHTANVRDQEGLYDGEWAWADGTPYVWDDSAGEWMRLVTRPDRSDE